MTMIGQIPYMHIVHSNMERSSMTLSHGSIEGNFGYSILDGTLFILMKVAQ